MAKPLSTDAAAQIQEIAAQISVAQDLDPEIQSELRSHLEDKFLGYLSGQERLSDADALLLTRAHFGDVRRIKSLFQHAHPLAYQVSIGRRIAAALIATLFISFVVHFVFRLLATFLFAHEWITASTTPRFVTVPEWFFLVFEVEGLIIAGILWKVFAWWRRGIAEGRRFWFQTWSVRALVLLVPAILTLQLGFSYFAPFGFGSGQFRGWGLNAAVLTVHFVSLALQILLWFWWSDQAPRTRRGLVFTAACWVAVVGAIYHLTWIVYMQLFWPHSMAAISQEFRNYCVITLLNRGLPAAVVLGVYLYYRRYHSSQNVLVGGHAEA